MTVRIRSIHWVSLVLLSFAAQMTAYGQDPWADQVINYTPGANPSPDPGYTNAEVALGSPTVLSGGFLVTPFSSAFQAEEIVSLGAGGELTVRFDEPVTDDPQNPFGIDLLVFGNAFLRTSDFNFDENTTATGIAGEGGEIWVSQDGLEFFPVAGVDADSFFPTNAYADTSDFFAGPMQIPADFTKPVDPNFNPVGLGAAATIAGYDGSGGGAGVDIGTLGLDWIRYVRITNPIGSLVTPEIDAFADVTPIPEPHGRLLVIVAGLFGCELGSQESAAIKAASKRPPESTEFSKAYASDTNGLTGIRCRLATRTPIPL